MEDKEKEIKEECSEEEETCGCGCLGQKDKE